MGDSETEGRQRLRRVRERLEDWKFDARERAYAKLFEGSDAALTEEELRVLDGIDSQLAREEGTGVWDTDEYGVVAGAEFESEAPLVVCTYHPEIPYESYRGEGNLDEATRRKLNDLLWNYGERVSEIITEELETVLEADRTD